MADAERVAHDDGAPGHGRLVHRCHGPHAPADGGALLGLGGGDDLLLAGHVALGEDAAGLGRQRLGLVGLVGEIGDHDLVEGEIHGFLLVVRHFPRTS